MTTELTYRGYELIFDFTEAYWIVRKGEQEWKGWYGLNYIKEWIDWREG